MIGPGIGILIILLLASFAWAKLDELTGHTKVPWFRRLFWRKTVGDLMAELETGQRTRINAEEIELAEAYQRRRLPPDIRFPQAGELYEVLDDFEAHFMTQHFAPFTGGGRAILPKGERVRVAQVSGPAPLSVYCDPLSYEDLEARMVPAEERAQETYGGYYLSIDTVDLNRYFRRVESEALSAG